MIEKVAEEKKNVLKQHGYRLYNEVLGVGAFSTVQTAYSNTHKCDVAIKIIPKVNGAKQFLTKFLPRELDIMRELVHPNVIAFLQAIETNVKIYLVLELVKGGSLLQIVHHRQKLAEDNAANVFLQLCNGMEYCHSKGVAHRDLKCENILLDKKGHVKIIDFGFGRGDLLPVKDKYTKSSTYCGSYAYASPEILQGIPYIPQLSDVWSLGVILYVMLCGYLPFEDLNLKRLIKLVLNGPVFKDIVLSTEATTLIKKVLVTEDKRRHVTEVKKNVWLQNIDMEASMIATSSLSLKTTTE